MQATAIACTLLLATACKSEQQSSGKESAGFERPEESETAAGAEAKGAKGDAELRGAAESICASLARAEADPRLYDAAKILKARKWIEDHVKHPRAEAILEAGKGWADLEPVAAALSDLAADAEIEACPLGDFVGSLSAAEPSQDDAVALSRALSAVAYVSDDPEQRLALYAQACTEIPSCGRRCAVALKKTASSAGAGGDAAVKIAATCPEIGEKLGTRVTSERLLEVLGERLAEAGRANRSLLEGKSQRELDLGIKQITRAR